MIEPEDMEAAIRRVQDFIDVQGPGSEEALDLHLREAGIAPGAFGPLIDFAMHGQPQEAAGAVSMLVTKAAATTLIAAEIAGEREAR